MGQYDTQLDTLKQSVATLRTARDAIKKPPPDPQPAEALERFDRALNFIDKRMADLDPFLVPAQQTQSLQAALTNLGNMLGQYARNASLWQQLINQTDHLLAVLTTIPFVTAYAAADQYSRNLADFQKRTAEAVKEAEGRAAQMEIQLKTVVTTAESLKATIVDYGKQLEQHKTRLDKVIPDGQAQIGNLIKEERAKFIAEETQRAEGHNKAEGEREARNKTRLEAIEKNFTERSEKSQSEFHRAMEAHDEHARAKLAEINRKLQEAEKVVGVIVATTMSGHYNQVASNEQEFANTMRNWATGFFITATVLVVAVIVTSEFSRSQLSWGAMAFRVAMAAVLFVPAFYFARESANHRRTANRLRRIELELAALEPFLRDLPVELRNEVLKKKADEYFGQETEQLTDVDNMFSRYLFARRFDKLLAMIAKVVKVGKGDG